MAIFFLMAMPVFGFQTEFIRQFDGAENVYSIDPVIDDSGKLKGLIYCVPADYEIIIDMFDNWDDIHVPLTMQPAKTINAYFDADTLYIYALQRIFGYHIYIYLSLIKVSDNQAVIDTTVRKYLESVYAIENYKSFENFNVKFWNDSNEIVIETCAHFEEYVVTQGFYACNASWSRSYSQNLRSVINTWVASSTSRGNINMDPEIETCSYTDYYMYSNPVEPDESDYFTSGTNVIVNQAISKTEYGNTYDLYLHNFIRTDDYDEFIYYGYDKDWVANYPVKQTHIACYGFGGTSPVQYWYNNQIDSLEFGHIYDNWHALVGIRNGNRIIFLDYTTGQISDSISLGKNLHATRFFETGNDTPLLSLVGRSNDSIFVYYFDSPVGLDDEVSVPAVPESFQLMQNFPNPFNTTTTISYYSPHRENVTISVYNILGRKIKTIHDKAASLGLNTIDWDATDSDAQGVSSGIYFYRIEAGDYSQTRKMLFLK